MQSCVQTLFCCFLVIYHQRHIAVCLDDPELAWPLTQNTSVYEVIEGGVAQINQCVVYNETHDILNRKTPYLSADHPYIDLNVESESFDDFCLTIAFKPKAIATGTLFDYRHTGSDDEVTEFRLAFTYDGSKTVLNARRKVDGTATIKLFTSAYTITNSQWHFLVFNIKSSVSFTIYLNSEIFSESPAGGDKRLETPGIIRLGAHLDTGANQFRGSLTCLCFFKDFLTISQKSQILNFCINKNIWNNNPPSIIQEHCPVPTVLPDSTTSSTVTTTNEATTTTSTTNEATTVVPTTDEATTIVPTTDEATTNAPTTDEATINVPTTNEATTIVPTTDEATTNMPSTNEATSIMSTTSEPTTCPTTTVEITTIAPTTDETTTSAPTTNIITTIMSTTTTTVEATTNAPTTDETTTSVPTTNEATTNILTTNEATTDTPTTNEETTNTPTTNEATSIKSTTSEATSSAPTTGEVTTSVPTTNEATTNMLTTIEATTDAPTTNQGTTITSTTNETTSNMTSQTISTSTTNQTPTPAFTTNGATTMTTQPPLPIPYNFFGYFKKAPAGIPNLLPTAMYVARSKYYCATYCISTSFDCQSFSVISSAGMFHCGLYHTIYTTGLTILPNAVYYHRKLV